MVSPGRLSRLAMGASVLPPAAPRFAACSAISFAACAGSSFGSGALTGGGGGGLLGGGGLGDGGLKLICMSTPSRQSSVAASWSMQLHQREEQTNTTSA
jgi:hypothetical protein